MNKTELTKRKIRDYDFVWNDGSLVGIKFTISHTIKKLHKFFPTIQIFHECFDEDGFGECYIMCKFSSDFKQVSSITYVIYEFKYNYKKEINCEDIFNEEEINLIKDEVARILYNLRYLMYSVNLRKIHVR